MGKDFRCNWIWVASDPKSCDRYLLLFRHKLDLARRCCCQAGNDGLCNKHRHLLNLLETKEGKGDQMIHVLQHLDLPGNLG